MLGFGAGIAATGRSPIGGAAGYGYLKAEEYLRKKKKRRERHTAKLVGLNIIGGDEKRW